MENTDKLNNYEDDEYKDAYVCFRNAGDVARLVTSAYFRLLDEKTRT